MLPSWLEVPAKAFLTPWNIFWFKQLNHCLFIFISFFIVDTITGILHFPHFAPFPQNPYPTSLCHILSASMGYMEYPYMHICSSANLFIIFFQSFKVLVLKEFYLGQHSLHMFQKENFLRWWAWGSGIFLILYYETTTHFRGIIHDITETINASYRLLM